VNKVAAVVLLVGVLALAGCRAPGAAPASSETSGTASLFGGSDRSWIQITMAMDELLLPLLDLVPQRSGSPEVQALALQVQAVTDGELSVLRELQAQAGLPATNPYKSTPVEGMVTPDVVSRAATLTGPDFDKVVVDAIKGHLEQSRLLADGEGQTGVEPQTRALALQVERTREVALETAKKAS
jgi:hypothetical protein